ncbi:MAG: Maf family nucleotide pyrophosphatase [Saprospiraceae bacterium]
MNSIKIILASKSPRRQQLLREAGFEFEIKTNSIEEVYPDTLPVREVPAYLSQLKADACTAFLDDEKVLLTADSVVIINDTIYGKPKDEHDAFRTIKALSGNIHEVITGVTLRTTKKTVTFSDVAYVHFDTLTDDEIWFYVNNYQPFDKAGAYAIQEWIGLTKIIKIDGSYYNIMGLPVQKVYQYLQDF